MLVISAAGQPASASQYVPVTFGLEQAFLHRPGAANHEGF
jgi:hypothetical protein